MMMRKEQEEKERRKKNVSRQLLMRMMSRFLVVPRFLTGLLLNLMICDSGTVICKTHHLCTLLCVSPEAFCIYIQIIPKTKQARRKKN